MIIGGIDLKAYIGIEDVYAMEIVDAYGSPALKVEVFAEGGYAGSAAVSTRTLRRRGVMNEKESEYTAGGCAGKINGSVCESLVGMNIIDQTKIDRKLMEPEVSGGLGSNIIFALSAACAKAAAAAVGLEPYRYLGGAGSVKLPLPMMNVISGGADERSPLNYEKIMIIPVGASSFSEGVKNCAAVCSRLKADLADKGYGVLTAPDGSFAPNMKNEREAFDYVCRAITRSGFRLTEDFCLAVDCGAETAWLNAQSFEEENMYYFSKQNRMSDADRLISDLVSYCGKYPIISAENVVSDSDGRGLAAAYDKLGSRIQLAGFKTGLNASFDDYNSVIVSPVRIGTISDTLDFSARAVKNGFKTVFSSEDDGLDETVISDLAVAANSGQIMLGALSGAGAAAKYNRLFEIEKG